MEVFTKDIELQEDGNVLIRAPVPSIGRLTSCSMTGGGSQRYKGARPTH